MLSNTLGSLEILIFGKKLNIVTEIPEISVKPGFHVTTTTVSRLVRYQKGGFLKVLLTEANDLSLCH